MFQKIGGIIIMLLFTVFAANAQNAKATVNGMVTDEQGKPIELVAVGIANTGIGTYTDPKGKYTLEVSAGKNITLTFSFLGYDAQKKTISVKENDKRTLNIVLSSHYTMLTEFRVKDNQQRLTPGTTYVNIKEEAPGPNDALTNTIKTLVGSHNELTSQYSVRGGNYDENLVYVNDFEIYRPYLVRSGQQEGLSFVNSDLISNVNFSLGGFQSKYGDKMSSVLDVTYKKPTQFGGSFMMSLLGANLHLEGVSKNKKLTYLIGVREKNNQYLLQSQPTKGVYNPSFTDVQALVNYHINSRWEVEAIGNYARNRFTFYPESQTTSFGVINQAYQLQVFYGGAELDQFDSRFAGISTTYRPNDKLKLKLLASGFQTNEQETYDIAGEYLFGELETDLGKNNFGQIKTYLGTGLIHNYARNYLSVNLGNVAHRGSYDAGKHFIQWGADVNVTNISDQLHEWERRDSAGFTQPYNPNALYLTHFYHSSADFDYTQLSGFLQDNFRLNDSLGIAMSAGVRFNYDYLNQEMVISPRFQASYKPRHWKRDLIFKVAGGLYAQPPFYREMRDLLGNVNKNLLAQKSFHYVAGADYNFNWWGRPMKVTAEGYYKDMWDIVPYTYDNVRIRYYGKNDAVGYAYGGELRLYGDIVKDAQSWISIGVLKTMEDLKDDSIVYKNTAGADSVITHPGYIPRPSDQRLMVGMYFEDYLPNNKNFRMHLNLIYATGLPFGAPDKPRYADTLRIPDYKRVDIGFSALLLDGKKRERPYHSFFREVKSIWASLEIFNLLGIQNTLSFSWIQDQSTNKNFAVPNHLTSRLVNVKIIVKF